MEYNRMGIREDIFEGFFKTLDKDKKFPKSIVERLRILYESEERSSKEKLLEIIKAGCENVNKN